jgi:hypothetical protein
MVTSGGKKLLTKMFALGWTFESVIHEMFEKHPSEAEKLDIEEYRVYWLGLEDGMRLLGERHDNLVK